jgi:hypothetical protein
VAAGFQEGARHLSALAIAPLLHLSDDRFLVCDDPLEGGDVPPRLLKSNLRTCEAQGYPVSASVVDTSGVVKLQAKGDHSMDEERRAQPGCDDLRRQPVAPC